MFQSTSNSDSFSETSEVSSLSSSKSPGKQFLKYNEVMPIRAILNRQKSATTISTDISNSTSDTIDVNNYIPDKYKYSAKPRGRSSSAERRSSNPYILPAPVTDRISIPNIPNISIPDQYTPYIAPSPTKTYHSQHQKTSYIPPPSLPASYQPFFSPYSPYNQMYNNNNNNDNILSPEAYLNQSRSSVYIFINIFNKYRQLLLQHQHLQVII